MVKRSQKVLTKKKKKGGKEKKRKEKFTGPLRLNIDVSLQF
jgi:hypothetical protein